jgi:hypothetical protein
MGERRACGFTLRLNPSGIAEEPWLRSQLLIPEKANIISADSLTWPQPKELQDLHHEDPDWHPLGIDTDFEEMLEKLHKRGVCTEGLVPLCITVSVETIAASERLRGPWVAQYPHEEELIASDWRFLGFEPVELNGLTSGLKGIGYKEPSWSQLRVQFGGALNEVGLFTDAAIAAEFAKMQGIEIPEHAPFDVVGILVHDPLSQ